MGSPRPAPSARAPRSDRGSARPRCAVVVVTYDSAPVVPGCLESIDPALAEIPAEVVVVDNGSQDGTVAAARCARPETSIVELGDNRGYAAGINAGLAAVGSWTTALLLNPDIRLAPGSVARLHSALDDPMVGIVAPRLVDEDGRLLPSLRRDPAVVRAFGEAVLGGRTARVIPGLGEMLAPGPSYARSIDVAWASGAALLVRRDCADDVGPWDESYFLYSEETDYALRARRAGYVVRYVPDAIGTHIGGALHDDPRLWALQVTNRVRCFARFHTSVHTAAYGLAVAVNEGLRAAVGPRAALHRGALAQVWRGCGGARPGRAPQ